MNTTWVERREGDASVPPTWCVVVCELGCQETWTVDVADFAPRLSPEGVVALLHAVLTAHERGCSAVIAPARLQS